MMLVEWAEYLPLFRKVMPRGTPASVVATREAYLQSVQREAEVVLARRTA
ncbi:MAG: hypothetical protein H0W67_06190 [Gemmatimonadales bacterium]|nr:hypothetical protein [Gemmatimonadales bacterium]